MFSARGKPTEDLGRHGGEKASLIRSEAAKEPFWLQDVGFRVWGIRLLGFSDV